MRYWLMKSEPDDCSIDDLAAMPAQTVAWYGVRNYQARNFMVHQMRPGDLAFFYHSSCSQPGIAGIVRVSADAAPDATQFDPQSRFFDDKATREKPRWFCVDVTFVRQTRLVGLPELRAQRDDLVDQLTTDLGARYAAALAAGAAQDAEAALRGALDTPEDSGDDLFRDLDALLGSSFMG